MKNCLNDFNVLKLCDGQTGISLSEPSSAQQQHDDCWSECLNINKIRASTAYFNSVFTQQCTDGLYINMKSFNYVILTLIYFAYLFLIVKH